MPRLPKPGSDAGKWGEILNEYLSTVHDDDGNLKDNSVGSAQLQDSSVGSSQLQDNSVGASQLQDNAITTTQLADDAVTEDTLAPEVVDKLNSAGVSSVATLTGDITSPDLVDALETDLQLHYAPVAGSNLTASGVDSWAEGNGTTASESYSHAEGRDTVASGFISHAEGSGTTASGIYSHAEGYGTTASGIYSHAEGYGTTASGNAPGSHAEGFNTVANGFNGAHAEGYGTIASGTAVHAEGSSTIASSYGSHAEGGNTKASGVYSHAEGNNTTAGNAYAHTEGYNTTAFRVAESTRGHGGQVQQAFIPASSGAAHQEGITYIATSGVITIPVHAGITRGNVTVMTEDGTISWDITFSANNNATTYATRATGTVNIIASAGTSSPTLGTSSVTWTVTGNATGQVIITPSTTPPAIRVWCELLQLGSVAQTRPA